jgi:hypothetical protein
MTMSLQKIFFIKILTQIRFRQTGIRCASSDFYRLRALFTQSSRKKTAENVVLAPSIREESEKTKEKL